MKLEEKMAEKFALLTFPGLGKLALTEIKPLGVKNSNILGLPNYDLVTFEMDVSNANLLSKCRISEDVFYVIIDNTPIKEKVDLNKISKYLTSTVIFKALEIKSHFGNKKRANLVTYNCFVKQDRDRFIPRKMIANKTLDIIGQYFKKWKIADPAQVELWGFYIEERLTLSLRLSSHKMRYHDNDPSLREGALRPTIAGALAFVADPKPEEIFVDPMCGTGTILLESFIREKSTKYFGGDISEEAIDHANEKLGKTNAEIKKWDAQNLPFENESIDCIASNLPFGKQYSTIKENKQLYSNLVSNWKTKLKEVGRMVLLTSDSENIESVLTENKMNWRIVSKVKVLGKWAKIYKATKY